jgi:hypothetical protein
MLESWEWLRARLTARRRVAVTVGLCAVVLAPVTLVIGVAVGQAQAAAVIALGIFTVVVAALVLAIAWARRRYRLVRAGLEGEAVDISSPSRVLLGGALRTPAADEVRLGLMRAKVPAHMIAAWGMSTRSPVARDQLAGMATGWRFDWSSLADVLRGTADPALQLAALGPTDPADLLLLARMIASQQLEPDDDAISRRMVQLVAGHPGRAQLSLSARRLLIERLAADGEQQPALALMAADGGRTLADRLAAWDLLNPFRETGPSLVAWLASVNGMYRRAGLEPLQLEDEGTTPFDRLRSTPVSRCSDDVPLVTIVLTSYRPSPAALRTAVLSILAQSWTAWELIIADDGSPAESETVLDEVASLDERISVLRSATNDGTYVRRNDAIRKARGELVTFLDSDDWAHPRRLELQVRHLLRHPAEAANVSRSLRVTPDMRFLQERGSMLRLTEASLLFRREAVISRIGWFDNVRKAADTGFRLRIEAAFARPVPTLEVQAPLTLVRYEPGSLSAGDLRDGWTHPARIAYSSALAAWMSTERVTGRPPYMPEEKEGRPFPVHPHLIGEDSRSVELDVVFVLDVRADGSHAAAAVDRDIADVADSGLRVGVRRAERIRSEWVSQNARRSLQNAINAGRIVEVIPDDAVSARLVVVPDASTLLGASAGTPIRVDRVVVVRDPSVSDAMAEEGVRRLAGTHAVVQFTDASGARKAGRAIAIQ